MFAPPFFEQLAEHVVQKINECWEKVATEDEGGGKSLKPKVFSRFYAEVLFRHFDANNDGKLQLDEVTAALKFMTKPNADGEQVAPVVAFPKEFTEEDGQVNLPIQWFWGYFSAME